MLDKAFEVFVLALGIFAEVYLFVFAAFALLVLARQVLKSLIRYMELRREVLQIRARVLTLERRTNRQLMELAKKEREGGAR